MATNENNWLIEEFARLVSQRMEKESGATLVESLKKEIRSAAKDELTKLEIEAKKIGGAFTDAQNSKAANNQQKITDQIDSNLKMALDEVRAIKASNAKRSTEIISKTEFFALEDKMLAHLSQMKETLTQIALSKGVAIPIVVKPPIQRADEFNDENARTPKEKIKRVWHRFKESVVAKFCLKALPTAVINAAITIGMVVAVFHVGGTRIDSHQGWKIEFALSRPVSSTPSTTLIAGNRSAATVYSQPSDTSPAAVAPTEQTIQQPRTISSTIQDFIKTPTLNPSPFCKGSVTVRDCLGKMNIQADNFSDLKILSKAIESFVVKSRSNHQADRAVFLQAAINLSIKNPILVDGQLQKVNAMKIPLSSIGCDIGLRENGKYDPEWLTLQFSDLLICALDNATSPATTGK
jgi:hypothetical protein